jgi:hypothetical protein
MKKKSPQQQVTPPTKGLNILSVKRSPEQVEPPQEQPAEELMEKPEVDATSTPVPVAQTPVDNPTHASEASEASDTVQMRSPLPRISSGASARLKRPLPPPREHSFKRLALSKVR